MELGKDLVAASATPLVLAILAEGESYGYAIIKRVAELSGGHLQWTDGMLYPVLHRLERQGLVAAKWGEAESGRNSRFTAVTIRVRLVVPAGGDASRARLLLEKSEKGCPVSNSLTAVKHLEAEIVEAA